MEDLLSYGQNNEYGMGKVKIQVSINVYSSV